PTIPDLFVALSERLSLKINDVIIGLEDRLDALEAQVDTEQPTKLRSQIARSRQDTVALRRYLSPQREALANLQYDAPDWLDPSQRMSLRETADRTLRYLEDLDAARDRAIVVLDELANKMAESMNRTMYALSIVAAIFLPLSFLTGLLGINVGGMPGVDSGLAFWITCAIMTILMVAEIYVLKRLKWI
ncbi:CorA family divalent cation transporter, partial [Parasphingorhabdus sp.]|uniref:CorA family divalent cation transporter n=1 Tax=Parasphingorhabdus sp. TaxID=2709688 RepID=UPI003C70FF2A